MKQLIKPYWLTRWRLRRLIAKLAYMTSRGSTPPVVSFYKRLEATLMMTEDLNGDDDINIVVTKDEVLCFTEFTFRLNQEKLNMLNAVRVALAAVAISDEEALGDYKNVGR